MQNFTLRKAERKQAKIRMGMFGPSGSGKTFSALLIAKGLAGSWDKVAVIDTENGSADLYSHLGDYNTITLEAPFEPEKYVQAIKACEDAGMSVIIVDSISHEWDGKGGCLESNELIAQTKFKGNTWAAWSTTTPRHQKFIESMVNSKCHIIACGRSKTDTIQTEDKKIKKVGMKEITRDGFEYEMTLSLNLDRDGHYATATKDRTRIFIDNDPFVVTEETGLKIKEWGESGAQDLEGIKNEIFAHLKRLGRKPETKEDAEIAIKEFTGMDLVAENFVAIAQILSEKKAPEIKIDDISLPAEKAKEEQPLVTIAAEPEAVTEPEEPISANKLILLRKLIKDKEGIEEDKDIINYIAWFHDIMYEKLENVPASVGNQVIKTLMEKRNPVEETDMKKPENPDGSEIIKE